MGHSSSQPSELGRCRPSELERGLAQGLRNLEAARQLLENRVKEQDETIYRLRAGNLGMEKGPDSSRRNQMISELHRTKGTFDSLSDVVGFLVNSLIQFGQNSKRDTSDGRKLLAECEKELSKHSIELDLLPAMCQSFGDQFTRLECYFDGLNEEVRRGAFQLQDQQREIERLNVALRDQISLDATRESLITDLKKKISSLENDNESLAKRAMDAEHLQKRIAGLEEDQDILRRRLERALERTSLLEKDRRSRRVLAERAKQMIEDGG
jgi:chromosome segregation ATPase